jgi:hypothetical protein
MSFVVYDAALQHMSLVLRHGGKLVLIHKATGEIMADVKPRPAKKNRKTGAR